MVEPTRRYRLGAADIRIENPSWSDAMVDDYLRILEDRDSLSTDIETNAANIANNATDIDTNATNIQTNADNFEAHDTSDSEHGVTGDNVGTEDFAQTLIGGVVLLADLVTDVAQTSSTIATADVGLAPATYTQVYAQEQTDLINELKATVNDLVTDTTDLVTQFNELLANMKTAKQMNTV